MKICLLKALFLALFTFAQASKKRGRGENYALESFINVVGDIEKPVKDDLALFFFELSTSEPTKSSEVEMKNAEQIFQEFEDCLKARNIEKLELMIAAGEIPQNVSDFLIEALVRSSTRESLFIIKRLLEVTPYVSDFVSRNSGKLAVFVAEEHGSHCVVVLDWLDEVSPEYSWKSSKSVVEQVVREIIVHGEIEYPGRLFSEFADNEEVELACDIIDIMFASMDACMLWEPILQTWNTYTKIFSKKVSSLAPDSLFIVLKAAYALADVKVTSEILLCHSPIVVTFPSLPFAQLGHFGRKEHIISRYSEAWIDFGELEAFFALLESVEFND